jgi:hypothetical protein
MNRHPVNNHASSESPEEFERQLYRLADGELPTDERRRLLRQLDELPGGWRRCAIVFLENQAFSEDLPAAMAPVVPAVATAKTQRWRWFATSLAIAASWLAMFVVGGLWQQSNPSNPAPNTRPIGLPPAIEQMLVRDHGEASGPGDGRVPIVSGSPNGDRWRRDPWLATDIPPLPSLPVPPVPPDMADILKVFREQGLEPKVLDAHIPVQLKDGRRLLIPVKKRDRREFTD